MPASLRATVSADPITPITLFKRLPGQKNKRTKEQKKNKDQCNALECLDFVSDQLYSHSQSKGAYINM